MKVFMHVYTDHALARMALNQRFINGFEVFDVQDAVFFTDGPAEIAFMCY